MPNLNSCVSCEADYKWDYPKRGKTQDHTRTINFNSIKNPYNIFIGVAGAEGVTSGDFEIFVTLKTKIQNTASQETINIQMIDSRKGETLTYKSDLSKGVKIHDLSWASKSSVACFPATQNNKFNGNHVLFRTEIPTRSKMEIT